MLKAETQSLWDTLKDLPAMGGFILIGGTALSMHLDHRISEDLDFIFDGAKLPRLRIELLKRGLTRDWPFVANDSPAAFEEFEDTGMELLDYQQNYVVAEQVKVTFVAPDPEVAVQTYAALPDRVRVASVEEIFRLKCIACANRTKTRDWLDMWVMFQQGLFQPIDMLDPFERAKAPQKLDIALRRMCSGRVAPNDEGYESLLSNPPSVQEMRDYFIYVRDEIEQQMAARSAHRGDKG